jgi:cytochrome oxidase Cu insertion factor (SCO1/SenC/PrrC family)
MWRTWTRVAGVIALLGVGSGAAAHDDHAAAPPVAVAGGEAAAAGATHDARSYFTDTELLDQHGRRLRFFSDALDGRVVLLNVVYTNCQDACPLLTARLNQVRARLGERFGRDVQFISLSSDPARDTPAALQAFARQHHADVAGWTFLTGSAEALALVLGRLGQFSPVAEDHSTLLIAGNVAAKRWSKIRPDASPAAIAERLLLLADGDGASR